MAICNGFKRNGHPCTFKCKAGSSFCGHHQSSAAPLAVDSLMTRKLSQAVYIEAKRLLAIYEVDLELTSFKRKICGLWSFKDGKHLIQIASDLFGVDFLETFVHEVAHATTWKLYKSTVCPHGKEWKREYHRLMKNFLSMHPWSDNDVKKLTNPGTRHTITLVDVKEKYGEGKYMCEFEVGQTFVYKDLTFIVTNKGRGVNYNCTSLNGGAVWKFPKFCRIE